MASRYWVGGTGNRNDSAHWSGASGGSGGASVPTSADNVFIDSNSGTGTWDCDVADFYCNNLTISTTSMVAGGATVPGNSKNIRIYGNLSVTQSAFFVSALDLAPQASDAQFLFSNTVLQTVSSSSLNTIIYGIEALPGSIVRFNGFTTRIALGISASGNGSVTVAGWVQVGALYLVDTSTLTMNSGTKLYYSNFVSIAPTCTVSAASDSSIICAPNDFVGLTSYFTGSGKTYGIFEYQPAYSITYLITDYADLIMDSGNTFSELNFGLGDKVNSRLYLSGNITVNNQLSFYRWSADPYTAPYRLYVAPYGVVSTRTITVLSTVIFGKPLQPVALRLTPSYITISGAGGRLCPAFTSNGCVDGGNNSGWDFGSSGFPILLR